MADVTKITRDSWILSTFPEWGTWINEEIENEQVAPNTVAMWWLGNMGTWIKTENNTNICIDLWVSTGKKTHKNPYMKPKHQHQRAVGCVALQPNLRNTPVVIDPFAIKNINAVLATHEHSDHIDVNVAAAVLQNCDETVKFIGPESCVKLWTKWGVPADRCITAVPGDIIKIKDDMQIVILESFDRTQLLTVPEDQVLKNNPVPDMNRLAVNYLVKTPGGNIYHAGDSHFSNYYTKHGNEHDVHVTLAGYGENPRGMTDKLTSSDILRMAEGLKTDVIIPIHYDIWTNFMADPKEILALWNMRKDRMKYKFRPFIWQPGGKFVYPNDRNNLEYMYPRGFEDAFTLEPDLPFTAIL